MFLTSVNDLAARLLQLLNEPLESVRHRQQTTLDATLGSFDQPFVLFGASGLGRKTVKALERIGARPVALIDNNAAIWGTEIDGIPVMSPAEAADRYDAASVGVLVTVWSGLIRDAMADRIAPLRELGFTRIGMWSHFAWKYPDGLLPHFSIDLPEKVLPQKDDILKAFHLLGDATSQQIFVNHVEWRLTQEFDLLPRPVESTVYFDLEYYTDSADEIIYDVGAFDGDSILDCARTGRSYAEYHAFEPVASNLAKLERVVQKLGADSVITHKMVLGDRQEEVVIDSDLGPASRVGHGDEWVQATTVDSLVQSVKAPTVLKMDIEGFEPKCLTGARKTIEVNQPVVTVSAYHLQNHLWSLLLQLHEYNPDYRFTLRPHFPDGWDLVLYAVPPGRVVSLSGAPA